MRTDKFLYKIYIVCVTAICLVVCEDQNNAGAVGELQKELLQVEEREITS